MGEFRKHATDLIEVGRQLYQLGMVPATSGNFSVRMSDGRIAITVSGRHKGQLTEQDIMLVDGEGRSLDNRRPSAETLLHTAIYQRYVDANAVLHPHSIHATLLSRLCGKWLVLQDYEILKAFPGINSHQGEVRVPVFDNDQDIERLAQKADACLATLQPALGYLIRGHGFYTWGNSLNDAMRHVEAFEFLFDCELRMKGMGQ